MWEVEIVGKLQNEAAAGVNGDGQESEVQSDPEVVYNAAGYLTSGCLWCPPGLRFVVPHVHCPVCGSGVCRVHVVGDLCPRCAVPQTAGDLRRLYFAEPDPALDERRQDERERTEVGARVMDEYDPLLRFP